MSVTSQINTAGPFAGSGTTGPFSFTFRIENKNQIAVFKTATDGEVTQLTVDTDYTVANLQTNTGTVTLTTALAVGETLFLASNYQSTQQTEFESQGGFFPDVHELSFDKLTFLILQLQQRALQLPQSSTASTLPLPREGYGIKYDSAGAFVEENLDNNLKSDGSDSGMQATLVMNGNRITGLPAPASPDEPVRSQDLSVITTGEGLIVTSNVENVVLTEAQTNVTLSGMTTIQTAFFVSGVNVDDGRLLPTIDYTVVDDNNITLLSTFPTGTIITAVQNEGAEEVQSDIQVFDNVAVMKAAPLNTGDTALCLRYYAGGDLVDGLLYEVKSSGTTDGYIDHDCANGTKVFYVGKETASQKAFGARMDGTTDDTAALTAWFNQTSTPQVLSGDCVVTGGIEITSPIIVENPEFKLIPQLGTGEFRLLHLRTNDVTLDISIDASADTHAGAVSNKYAVHSGDSNGATKYRNHKVKLNLTGWLYSDGNTGSTNLKVSHGHYVYNVDNVDVSGSVYNQTSGAAYFIRECVGFKSHSVKAIDNVWYPFNLEEGVEQFDIQHCYQDQTGNTNGVYWGGGINIQSQQVNGGARNIQGIVAHNELKGKYSYGSVIRCNSAENVVIENNRLLQLEQGAVTSGAGLTGIRVDTRGISTAAQNGPCQGIVVKNNKLEAINTGTNFIAIYASNQWQTARNPFKGLTVEGNEIISADTSNYWESAIIVHGFSGGIEQVVIKDNYGSVYMQSGPIVDGAIGLVATNAGGKVDGVTLGNNVITDLGTATQSYQTGIGYGAFIDNVAVTSSNKMENFFYPTRSFTNSGPTLNYINDIVADSFGSALIGLFGVAPSRYRDLGEVVSSSDLNDATNSVNLNKWDGKQVFDTTTSAPLYAENSNATGAWKDVTGATVYTPS